MVLEKVRKAIEERRANSSPLENDIEVLERIKSGYFEETKDFIVVNLENPIKNDKGAVILEKLNIKKKILGRDMLRVSKTDELSGMALRLSIDREFLKYIPAFIMQIITFYFLVEIAKKKGHKIEEKGGFYVYKLEDSVSLDGENLKEMKVLSTAELNAEHFSKILVSEGEAIFDVISQVFAVKKELVENMSYADLENVGLIIDKLKKKRW